jgi:exosortase
MSEPTTSDASAVRAESRTRDSLAPSPSEWLLLGALILAFAPALLSLHEVWSSVDYYSHGYLVAPVAFWAASAQRATLRSLARVRDRRALALLVASLALYCAGALLASPTLQGAAFVAALTGALWWSRGLAWLRALMFPLGYLLFMVPLPEPWLAPAIVQLQLGVSAVGVDLLRIAGFAVFRDGNVIDLPGGDSLFVAEACSGITSLVTLVPIAAIVAYFNARKLSRRLLLIAAVVPLALLGNLIRVVFTVVAATRVGASAATSGPVHDWAGLLTYALACGALVGLAGLVRHWLPETTADSPG